MFLILYTFLILGVARCIKDPLFETKTFDVGETVTLKCPCDASETNTNLYWIRLLSGNLPEFLGGSATFYDKTVHKHSAFIKTKQESGVFVLNLDEAKLSDTGFYYCVKVKYLIRNMTLVTGTFLKIQDPKADISVVSPDLSGPVHSGHSVDLQCWVQTENQQCLEEHMVLWFRSGLDQSSPGLVYTQRNSSGECGRSPEDHGPHKCFYTFSKTMSPSDAGTYHCAVAACGQILFGNGTKVHVKGDEKCVFKKTVLIVLSVLLTIGLIIIFILICSMKRKCCCCCFLVGQNLNDAKMTERTNQQRDAEVMYSAPTFNKKKAEKSQRRTVKADEHVVYSDVRVKH